MAEKTPRAYILENKFAKVVISNYGAHIVSWTLKNLDEKSEQDSSFQKWVTSSDANDDPSTSSPLSEVCSGCSDKSEVFFLSKLAKLDGTKPIRGGIPICFPIFSNGRWFEKVDVASSTTGTSIKAKRSGLLAFPAPNKGPSYIRNNVFTNDNADKRHPNSHGMARRSYWNFESLHNEDQVSEIIFSLNSDIAYGCKLCYKVRLVGANTLKCQLEILHENESLLGVNIQLLLHAYFRVHSSEQVKIKGLKGKSFVNSLQTTENGEWLKVQEETRDVVKLKEEVDRIYCFNQNFSNSSVYEVPPDGLQALFKSPEGLYPPKTNTFSLNIEGLANSNSPQPSNSLQTSSSIANTNSYTNSDDIKMTVWATSDSTVPTVDVVVWNPYINKSKRMGDFGDDEWQEMVCVEPGCVSQPIFLNKGQKAHFSMELTRL
eukprot:g540.t1